MVHCTECKGNWNECRCIHPKGVICEVDKITRPFVCFTCKKKQEANKQQTTLLGLVGTLS